MKKILLTCTDLMAIQFMVPHIRYLSENGFSVELACSVVGDRYEDLKVALDGVAKIHKVRLVRNPFSLTNFKGYKDLRKIISENKYDLIWTNEPVMGVVTRLAARTARKNGTTVLYMAHGFHFFKGAPLGNWMLWTPIEYIMSYFNDVLVTINWEDYNRAKKYMKTPEILHIDGIGVDFSNRKCTCSRDEKRDQLGVSKDEILITSVGELQDRKNHAVIVRAVAQLKNKKIKCVICGRGELENQLKKLIKDLNVEDQVFLLGYRHDIPEIMLATDIYAHPSKREGLGLASLEAMASGLPLVTSNTQGIPDYVENGVTGYMCDPDDVESYARNIKILVDDKALREKMSKTNLQRVQKYKVEVVEREIEKILKEHCSKQR